MSVAIIGHFHYYIFKVGNVSDGRPQPSEDDHEGFLMFAFVPQIYPGELLYSFLARLIHQNGWSTARALSELYGQPYSRCCRKIADLPSQLQSISKKFQMLPIRSTSILIKKHTLYPYYASYTTPGKAAELKNGLLLLREPSRCYLPTGRDKPINRSKLKLKFCKKCNQESVVRYGEMYWMRSHQLPLVDVCHRHRCLLQLSNVNLIEIGGDYVHASEVSCAEDLPESLMYSQTTDLDQLHSLAKRSADLLIKPILNVDLEKLRQSRLNRLQRIGLAKSNNFANYEKICEEADRYLSSLIAAYPFLKISNYKHGWVAQLLQSEKYVNPPVYHLLYEILMDGAEQHAIKHSMQAITPTSSKPFGDGPWLCGNDITCDRGLGGVSMESLRYRRGGYSAHFKCGCGFRYTAFRRLNSNQVHVGFRAFGADLEKHLISNNKNSLRKTAKKLQVSCTTIFKTVRKLEKTEIS